MVSRWCARYIIIRANATGGPTVLTAEPSTLREYAVQVLSILPQLEKLDEQPVSSEEVSAARRLYPDLPPAPQSPVPSARATGSHGPCLRMITSRRSTSHNTASPCQNTLCLLPRI